MNTTQLLENVRFIVDAKGHQSGVLLSLEDWDKLLTILEDYEDAQEICQAREQEEEEISWDEAKAELGLKI